MAAGHCVEIGRAHDAEQDAQPGAAEVIHHPVQEADPALSEILRAAAHLLLEAVVTAGGAIGGLYLVVAPLHLLLGPAEACILYCGDGLRPRGGLEEVSLEAIRRRLRTSSRPEGFRLRLPGQPDDQQGAECAQARDVQRPDTWSPMPSFPS